MARGKWTMSFRDKARAQYQADQIAQALQVTQQPANAPDHYQLGYQAGFQAGYRAARGYIPDPPIGNTP